MHLLKQKGLYMSHLIFSYILTGTIFAAINDIFVLPEYVKNHPEDECLSKLKYRTIISLLIIFGWIPLGVWMLYQALTYTERK